MYTHVTVHLPSCHRYYRHFRIARLYRLWLYAFLHSVIASVSPHVPRKLSLRAFCRLIHVHSWIATEPWNGRWRKRYRLEKGRATTRNRRRRRENVTEGESPSSDRFRLTLCRARREINERRCRSDSSLEIAVFNSIISLYDSLSLFRSFSSR